MRRESAVANRTRVSSAAAEREPSSERQAAAWRRVNYFHTNRDELERKRTNGVSAREAKAQREARGAGYLHVRDWAELDGYAFRSRVTRPFADILLSLVAFKGAHCLIGSHKELADMLSVFGCPCSPSTVRRVIVELAPFGLKQEPWCKHYDEGFLLRKDRQADDESERRTSNRREASHLYSLTGSLAELAERVRSRATATAKRRRRPRRAETGSIRLATKNNLSGSLPPTEVKQTSRQPRRAAPNAGASASSSHSKNNRSVRPSAANRSTARPTGAPDETAKREGPPREASAKNTHAEAPRSASEPRGATPSVADTPAPASAADAKPTRRPTPAELKLVGELARLVTDDLDVRPHNERHAVIAALTERAGELETERAAEPTPTPGLEPAATATATPKLTPVAAQRAALAAIPLLRAARDRALQQAAGALSTPPGETPAEARSGERAERQAEAAKRSWQRTARPSVEPARLADAFETTLAGLNVGTRGGAAGRAAVERIERERKRDALDQIRAAVGDLGRVIARLPAARAALVDRAVCNLVAHYERGELNLADVVRQLDVQRRLLATAHDGDGAPALARPADAERARAVKETCAAVDRDADEPEREDDGAG